MPTSLPIIETRVARKTAPAHAGALSDVAILSAHGWQAELSLGFERRGPRTVLARRAHHGPLVVQRPLYPEGEAVCQCILVHPPGGIVGGDRLGVAIDLDVNAQVQIATVGAAKWYRSNDRVARFDAAVRIGPGSSFEWLPHETILFDGACAEIHSRIDLAGDARYLGWEITGLGRSASGERFSSGRLRQSIQVTRNGALLWAERAVLEGGSRALQTGAVMAGATVFATLLAVGDIGPDAIAACRAVGCGEGEGTVTRVAGVVIARYRGASTGAARTYFAGLWRALRPALSGREAVLPRIWNA